MDRRKWEYRKLGEVCVSDLGKTLNSTKDKGELLPYLCAINILWDKIDLSTLKQTRFEQDELERYTVRKGDLLVCEGGDIGRAAIWDKDDSIQYQNALHRIRFNGSISPRFCLYYLWNLKLTGVLDGRYGKGITIKHLVKSALMSIPVPIPTLSDQQQIVAELDKQNEVIALKRKQLAELDSLAQSLFYEMFGNKSLPQYKLSNITSKMGSGATPDGGNQSYKSEGTSLIRSLNVHNNEFVYKELAHIDQEQARKLNNVIVEDGDVLLNITGASVARCCIVPKDLLPARVNQHVMILRPKTELVTSIYLCAFFTSKEEQQKLLLLSKSKAATREALPKSLLEEYKVKLPPLPLQQSFATKVMKIEVEKQQVKASLKDLETLLASRMQYWFDN